MKLILLVLMGFSCRTINARLIEKVTDRPLTTETKTTGSSPPVRLTRDVFQDDLITGSSKEEAGSEEQVRTYNKKMKLYSKSKLRIGELPNLKRITRESNEKVDKPKKNTNSSAGQTKQKSNLVNKPIPKFNEMDYDDDFQMKISRSPLGVADSSEHEDEDFNVDDYDFDVNHDEFVGRGKPLEPRQKNKMAREHSNPHPTKQPAPHLEVTKVAATQHPISNKKERAAQYIPKKAGEKEDYYDDTTTIKVPEKEKPRDLEDEFNDENEESKEFDNKGSPGAVRTIRSPWKMGSAMDKFGDKGSSVMAKVLSILPMFPQVPYKNPNNYGSSKNPWYRT